MEHLVFGLIWRGVKLGRGEIDGGTEILEWITSFHQSWEWEVNGVLRFLSPTGQMIQFMPTTENIPTKFSCPVKAFRYTTPSHLLEKFRPGSFSRLAHRVPLLPVLSWQVLNRISPVWRNQHPPIPPSSQGCFSRVIGAFSVN